MMKKPILAALALALALLLCACRVRTTLAAPDVPEAPVPAPRETDAPTRIDAALPPEPAEEPEEAEPDETPEEAAPDAPAVQDENAERREFDAAASGELTPEAETALAVPAETPAESAVPAAGEGEPVNTEADGAALTATETVPADEAEQLGADESGETAESAQTYYLALLDSRLGSLFECKRLYVYWETGEDHRTVHRSSPEHRLILGAGAYDVSAKLLEEDLTVDDGWVTRKAPDVVVKVADGGALDAGAARALCEELASRPGWAELPAVGAGRVAVLSSRLLETPAGQIAAMVSLAKLAYPSQMEDVDADEALRALTGEAFGSPYGGLYFYSM